MGNNGISILDPMSHLTAEQYQDYWQMLFSTILDGFWAKFFAASMLFFAFWFGVRRASLPLGMLFLGLAILITYMGPLLRFFGLMG